LFNFKHSYWHRLGNPETILVYTHTLGPHLLLRQASAVMPMLTSAVFVKSKGAVEATLASLALITVTR